MIISALKQLGNDIDVYLTSLIEDLRISWEEDVYVDDAYTCDNFKLCAMLFCTIYEFPSYSNLSRYNVKGHKACPVYEDDTCFHQYKNK